MRSISAFDRATASEIAFFNAVSVMVAFGIVTLFQPWAPVPMGAGFSLAAAAIVVLFAYICSICAMRVGEIATVAPFRYTALLWALLLGLLFFDEWPDLYTLIGAGIVVATGVALLAFERQARLRDQNS